MARWKVSETFIDVTGAPVVGASVTVREPGTTTALAQSLYAADSGGSPLSNPRTTDAAGSVTVYLATPQRVDLFVVAAGLASFTLPNVTPQYDPALLVTTAADAQAIGAKTASGWTFSGSTWNSPTINTPTISGGTMSGVTFTGATISTTNVGASGNISAGGDLSVTGNATVTGSTLLGTSTRGLLVRSDHRLAFLDALADADNPNVPFAIVRRVGTGGANETVVDSELITTRPHTTGVASDMGPLRSMCFAESGWGGGLLRAIELHTVVRTDAGGTPEDGKESQHVFEAGLHTLARRSGQDGFAVGLSLYCGDDSFLSGASVGPAVKGNTGVRIYGATGWDRWIGCYAPDNADTTNRLVKSFAAGTYYTVGSRIMDFAGDSIGIQGRFVSGTVSGTDAVATGTARFEANQTVDGIGQGFRVINTFANYGELYQGADGISYLQSSFGPSFGVGNAGCFVSKDMTYTGVGARIFGDFSNATITSRTILQTTGANSATILTLIPNGTATVAALQTFINTANLADSGFAQWRLGTGELTISTNKSGAGTTGAQAAPPSIALYPANNECFRVSDSSGTKQIGFFAHAVAAQPSGTPAAATDLATVITLANALRTGLLALGLFA